MKIPHTPLDKELYRQAQEYYRQWNDAKLRERAEMAGRLSSSEAFRQYAGLVDFIWQLCPDPPARQRQEKIEAWERYYAQIQKLEAWRRTHRKTA